jgi:AcrR family transcriptional regulator
MAARRTQAQRSAASTQTLLDATIGLIAERGVDGFSIADVADRAGVSRGLPTHHFETRDGLLLAVAKVVAKRCEPPPAWGLDPLLGWYKKALRDAQDPSPELRALMALLTARVLPPAVEKHVGAFLEAETEIARRHLEAGMAAGTIRRPLDPPAHGKVLAAAMAGQIALAMRLGLSEAQVDDFIAMLSAELGTAGDQPRAPKAPRPPSVKPAAQPGLFD